MLLSGYTHLTLQYLPWQPLYESTHFCTSKEKKPPRKEFREGLGIQERQALKNSRCRASEQRRPRGGKSGSRPSRRRRAACRKQSRRRRRGSCASLGKNSEHRHSQRVSRPCSYNGRRWRRPSLVLTVSRRPCRAVSAVRSSSCTLSPQRESCKRAASQSRPCSWRTSRAHTIRLWTNRRVSCTLS